MPAVLAAPFPLTAVCAGRRVVDDCAVAIVDTDVAVGGVAAGAVADDQIGGKNAVVVRSDTVNALSAAERQRK